MPGSTGKLRNFKKMAGLTIAFAVPVAVLAGAAPVESPATASEIAGFSGFDDAFAAFAMPEGQPIMTPAERLEAETLSAAAPRERKAKPRTGQSARRIRSGYASYYGARFAGRKTANGEIFNPRRLTAAHRTLPFGSKVKVTNRRNGKSVVVRINDRGPFAKGRVIDLSKEAARRIGLIRAGHGPVELALLR